MPASSQEHYQTHQNGCRRGLPPGDVCATPFTMLNFAYLLLKAGSRTVSLRHMEAASLGIESCMGRGCCAV